MDFQEGGHACAGLHRRGSRALSTDAAIRQRDAKYKCAERGAKKTAAGKIDRPILGQRLRLKKVVAHVVHDGAPCQPSAACRKAVAIAL
jgi:hypothetical protein